MEDTSNTLISAAAAAAATHGFRDFVDGDDAAAEDDEEEDDDEFCDVETWETLSKSFREVQSLLDCNRRLIQQVNDNHRSKIPQKLARNVDLICEINSNMSKVVALYSNLSANLSAVVHQRRAAGETGAKKVES